MTTLPHTHYGSMGLVDLPTWMVEFYGEYTSPMDPNQQLWMLNSHVLGCLYIKSYRRPVVGPLQIERKKRPNLKEVMTGCSFRATPWKIRGLVHLQPWPMKRKKNDLNQISMTMFDTNLQGCMCWSLERSLQFRCADRNLGVAPYCWWKKFCTAWDV